MPLCQAQPVGSASLTTSSVLDVDVPVGSDQGRLKEARERLYMSLGIEDPNVIRMLLGVAILSFVIGVFLV
jgi:hypothetical protein